MRTGVIADTVIGIPGDTAEANDRVVVDLVAGAEIDIVLVGLEIDTGGDGGVGEDIAIPPVKIGFAGVEPGQVFDGAGIVQIGEEIGFEKGAGSGSYEQYPPWGPVRQRRFYPDGGISGGGDG